jgi:hypothetical protein
MQEIITILSEKIALLSPKDIIEFSVINPDIETSKYSGTNITINKQTYIYRSYKSWFELSNILKCKLLTPIISQDLNFVTIRYEKLNSDVSFHNSDTKKEEKYGVKSIFGDICKNEEASYIYYYHQALKNINLHKRKRVLNLGVNSADEFEAIVNFSDDYKNIEFVGVDYCSSAIQAAKEKFKNHANFTFYEQDINQLEKLDIDKFDLIITIGTLQSSNLEFNKLLMSIVQNQLKKDGAIILGFPNCRWIDGEMIYGARVKNYPFSEMGLLYKDVIFAKKYLQQKKFRVTITGKDYIFLTATSIR